MDWNAAIEKNREALKRTLTALVAMAGLAGSGSTLPRHLHRAVLRLLRPAEAATRRLVIVAARSVVVAPPPPRSARSPSPAQRGRGTAEGGGGGVTTRLLTLPLLDPLRLPRKPRRPVANAVPRISVPGYSTPAAIASRCLPAPDDPVDATRLGRRFAALASALDDLPTHARRFARWRARRDAAVAQDRNRDAEAVQTGASRYLPHKRRRPRRLWPLRPGRPPGWRRRPKHEIHEVLNVVHGLAFWALERPDTS